VRLKHRGDAVLHLLHLGAESRLRVVSLTHESPGSNGIT
jgi:hypothetical protein